MHVNLYACQGVTKRCPAGFGYFGMTVGPELAVPFVSAYASGPAPDAGGNSHVFYETDGGQCFKWDHYHGNWDGQQGAEDEGDRVGLLLDLGTGSGHSGTLTAFLNGEQLGLMVSGLSGPLCWAVDGLPCVTEPPERGRRVRIDSVVPIPHAWLAAE